MITNRRLFLSLATATAAAMMLGACTSSGSPAHSQKGGSADTTSASTPKTGGSLTVGITTAPDNLDPNVASSADDSLIMRQIFDSLVTETADHQFKPWLATSWKVSSDGKQYTFKLKSGVTFQDGTPFNAAAVKTNLDRILDPKTKSQFAASLLGPVNNVVAVNPTTVRIDLKSPFNALLSGLSEAFLGIESPAAIAKYGAKVGQHPVGTGPFTFQSETTNQQVVLTANPKYDSPPATATHTGAPYLSKITFKVVPDATARVGGLQNGELDAIEGVPAEQINTIKSNSSLSVQVIDVPGAAYSLYLNERSSPWGDVVARRAVREAIDVDTIVKTLYFGQYPRAWSVLSPATEGYDASLENSYKYDPSAATSALEGLGYTKGSDGYLQKDGKDLSLLMVNNSPDYDKRFEIDTIVQQELKAVGIKDTISDVAFAQYASATENGKYDMESFSVTAGGPGILDTIFNSKNQPDKTDFLYNVAHYSSSKMDSLGAQAAAAPTPAAADQYYKQMQQLVFDDAVAIPIYVDVVTFAAQKSVSGVSFDPRTYADFYDASK